ncbi:MAG: enoyl-CoA hydratase/isomerase [Alphaproteobacteria bacterium]|nr:enoyl-CoA hydratase/isomerase [Alphaproteobacteria bacterium]
MNFEYDFLKLDIENNIATLTFNDPDALNAMSGPMLASMDLALDEIENTDNGVRALIVTGAGRGFCAGANVARIDGGTESAQKNRQSDAGEGLEKVYHPLLRRFRNLHCPIVSAVNGPCAGVGMSFALMGDMVVANESAFFLQAFRRIGLVPDGGATYLLPRLVGMARARELAIMGERLPSKTALEWGLINRVVADHKLLDEAGALAAELAQGPHSLKLIRNLLWESVDAKYEEQLNNERQAQRTAGRTEDFKEGVTAFNDKREAKFTGK